MIPPPVDPWAVLGVGVAADEDHLRRAYRERAKALHPDAGGDPDAMRRLNEAWAILSDPAGRAALERRRAGLDQELAVAPARPALDLARGALLTASSTETGPPSAALGSGWRAAVDDGSLAWLRLDLAGAAFLSSFSADALPLAYPVKRRCLAFVERHRLYGLRGGTKTLVADLRVPTSGDRDLAITLDRPAGPFDALVLETERSPAPPGWKHLRCYGYPLS